MPVRAGGLMALIDWRDPEARKAYVRHYAPRYRTSKENSRRRIRFEESIRQNATPLAKQVMFNEFERYCTRRVTFKFKKKQPESDGNAFWQALGRMER